VDADRLRASFRRVSASGDALALWFYADLFIRCPEAREMFPASMAEQRRHLLAALAHIVAAADKPDLAGYLRRLGVTHRRFGVLPGAHYEAVGASLLAALAHFEGEHWVPEVAEDWAAAYGLISGVMTAAATEDEQSAPAWWDGEVTECERAARNVSVLRVAINPHLSYLPGQAVRVQVLSRPRLWRHYMPGPGTGTDAELHVRAAGPVSQALASAEPGTRLRLMPAAEPGLALRSATRPVLMAAWSAGIAPMLALLAQIAAMPAPVPASLYWGAADAEGLYLRDSLEKTAAQHPWLAFTPVTPEGGGNPAGCLAGAVAAGSWDGYDAYIAGSSAAAGGVTARLAQAGMAPDRITSADFGWDEP
jgi:NAD(P)H-flavin reductase/hemoglobin-like flavoprotein